jgi:hypothetical protein
MHAYEIHTYKMHVCKMYACKRYTPVRYTSMKGTLMRYTSVRCTPVRCTPVRYEVYSYTHSQNRSCLWVQCACGSCLPRSIPGRMIFSKSTVRSKSATHKTTSQPAILACILRSIHLFPAYGCSWSACEVRLFVRVFSF